jgi:predicted metal-dependent hydrolase
MQARLPFDTTPDHNDEKRGVASGGPVRTPHNAPAALRALADAAPEFVRHPRARRYVVRVKSDGSVRVTIPRWGTRREAQAFAEAQRDWIDKQRAKLEAGPRGAAPLIQADAERELRKRATRELPARLLTLAGGLGLTVARVSIRNQRWRWGSCSRSGHICLNWRLVAMPDWVRDYVMLHELMHLKRMDHSPRFWKLVARVCPTFQEARTWLRQHQALLDAP